MMTIPEGSIIHHSKRITTVFDKNGDQFLAVNDDQSPLVPTIKEEMRSTYVHEVPNNSIIIKNGNILQVVHDDARILTIINSNSNESYSPVQSETCFGPPYNNQWVEGTEGQIGSTSGVSQFTTDLSYNALGAEAPPLRHPGCDNDELPAFQNVSAPPLKEKEILKKDNEKIVIVT